MQWPRFTLRMRWVAAGLLALVVGGVVGVLIHVNAPAPGTGSYQRYATLTPNLWLLSGPSMCAATRIGPKTLITARHCVDLKARHVAYQAASGASASFTCSGPAVASAPPDLAICRTTAVLPRVTTYETVDLQAAIKVDDDLHSAGFKQCNGPGPTYAAVGMATHRVSVLPTTASDELQASNGKYSLCVTDSGAPVLQPVGSQGWRIVGIVKRAQLSSVLVATVLGAADLRSVGLDPATMCIHPSASPPPGVTCRVP